MRRRSFLAGLFGAVATPLAAEAQPAGKVWRIGYLSESSPPAPGVRHPFFEASREIGWVDGQNVIIEPRWAQGGLERLPDLAAELVRLDVDVIVTGFNRANASPTVTKQLALVMPFTARQ